MIRQSIIKTIAELAALYRRQPTVVRAGVWPLLAGELVLIVAAERDIQSQPAGRIRGPKLFWRAVATQNVIGPAVYFRFARRSTR